MTRLVALALVGLTAAVCSACSAGPAVVERSGLQRVQVVDPLPADAVAMTGYRTYFARDDLLVNGRPAVDTFGVTHLVATSDGTVFALQDSRVSVGDSDEHWDDDDWGRALIRISPDGVASLVENPYADRAKGRDVAPVCASSDGELIAREENSSRLVARDRSGKWRSLTASRSPFDEALRSNGDGGPASAATVESFRDCAVTPDGSMFIADACLLRRIDPDGMIDTVAGRPELKEGWGPGCGDVNEAGQTGRPSEAPTFTGVASEAELGDLSAIAAAPDGSVWMSAVGLQHLTSDGQITSVPVPRALLGPSVITSLATLDDGTLLAAYGMGPTGIASRDATTGEWTVLVSPDDWLTGTTAPAPLARLSLYGADLSTGAGRIYLGVRAFDNAGVVAVQLD